MATSVVNLKYEEYEIYIGRGSKWGNPFKIGIDGDRKEVIEKYKHWIRTQPQLLADLYELKGRALGCFCKPKICHGNILAKLADLLVA
jgi:hypothetical protein